MLVIFNIFIIGLVLIIAYWWANQGLFSALLHLLCVIVAAGIAFGVWEPLVVGVLLKGGWFDQYAWGVTLVGVFAVMLFLLRLGTDRLAPSNVDLPRWANLAFGFPVGLAAGVITIGVLVIGCGFVQSKDSLMGYKGYGRNRSSDVVRFSEKLWLPVTYWTSEFYGYLSVTGMWSNKPLRQYNPQVYWQASLLRDSYDNGRGQLTMTPDAIRINGLMFDPQRQTAAVDISFTSAARDFNEQLTLSNSQVRLIGDARGKEAADIAYPQRWVQKGTEYKFDYNGNYITSTPGQESAEARIVFDRIGFTPKFIQVRGIRYRLPTAAPLGDLLAMTGEAASAEFDATARPLDTDDLKVSNSIRPVRVSANTMPGSIKEKDKYLTQGHALFKQGGYDIARNLMIKGIYEPPGTRILTLDVSRGRTINMFDRELQDLSPEGGPIVLVDDKGNTYSPIGFIYEGGGKKKETEVKLAPGTYVRFLRDLPPLPNSGAQKLRLFFQVTAGNTIVAVKYGDETLGTCSVEAPPGASTKKTP